MGSLHQICLRWNNHQSNFPVVFNKLLNNKDFVDVTLTCEGQSVKAHKIVLSACSPYFHTLFLDNPCKHPIVILKDVRYVDLKCIVEYVYKGEVSIGRDQLSEFLRTAQSLQIKGLSADENENVGTPSTPIVQSGVSMNESNYHPETPATANNYLHHSGYVNESFKLHHQSGNEHSPPLKHKETSKASRPSGGQLPASKMPRLSAAPWKDKSSGTPPPPSSKKAEVPESEMKTVAGASDTQEDTHVVTEPDYPVDGEERPGDEEDDSLSITVHEDEEDMARREGGQDVADDELSYEQYSADPKLLREIEGSVGLSDASDSGEMNLESLSQDPGGGSLTYTGSGASQGNSSSVIRRHTRGRARTSRWSMTTMQQALGDIISGKMSVSMAAKVHQIPERTMYLYWSKLKNYGTLT